MNLYGWITGSTVKLVLLLIPVVLAEQKITLKPPQLSEEEQRSNHMPDEHLCEGCRAIAYQIQETLEKAHEKLDKHSTLPESEIISKLDEVCENKFEGYGLTVIRGMNRLTGPGLSKGDGASITQMGGWWPRRLQDLCHYYRGEVDEMDIYELWLPNQEVFQDLFCGGGFFDVCSGEEVSARDDEEEYQYPDQDEDYHNEF